MFCFLFMNDGDMESFHLKIKTCSTSYRTIRPCSTTAIVLFRIASMYQRAMKVLLHKHTATYSYNIFIHSCFCFQMKYHHIETTTIIISVQHPYFWIICCTDRRVESFVLLPETFHTDMSSINNNTIDNKKRRQASY